MNKPLLSKDELHKLAFPQTNEDKLRRAKHFIRDLAEKDESIALAYHLLDYAETIEQSKRHGYSPPEWRAATGSGTVPARLVTYFKKYLSRLETIGVY
jgi:hypothetical protein